MDQVSFSLPPGAKISIVMPVLPVAESRSDDEADEETREKPREVSADLPPEVGPTLRVIRGDGDGAA